MATDDATITAESAVDDDGSRLRAVAHRIASLFAGEPRVTIDRRYDANPFGRPSMKTRLQGWEYNLRLTAPPDAAETLEKQVIPELMTTGWQVTDRSSERELAFQFHRDGTNLGVHVARAGGGDVVIGGSTPPR